MIRVCHIFKSTAVSKSFSRPPQIAGIREMVYKLRNMSLILASARPTSSSSRWLEHN
jgi:hypothetical protein